MNLSVIIPVHNDARHLGLCLEALLGGEIAPFEILIVDGGVTKEVPPVAHARPCRFIANPGGRGSFAARNAAAAEALGDILVFVDSDVTVAPDTLSAIRRHFEADASLAAVFGTYDNAPACPDFISQFRNLLHSFMHQSSRPEAHTFWTGCGAVRAGVFRDAGGFSLDRDHLRDVEFGIRLARAGHKIRLDREMRAKHWKRWNFAAMVRTDIFHRGANWTEILLRERSIPDDLNLRISERLSVGAIFLFPASVAFALLAPGPWRWLGLIPVAVYTSLGAPFFAYLARNKGAWFAFRAIPMRAIYHLCCGLGVLAGLARHYCEMAARVGKPGEPKDALARVLPGVGKLRRRLINSILILFLGIACFDIAIDREHWPFSNYTMYSRVSPAILLWMRVDGVTAGGEVDLPLDSSFPPFDQVRLVAALGRVARSARGPNPLHSALANLLSLYDGHRSAVPGPPAVARLRLYDVAWGLHPGLTGNEPPDRRVPVAEAGREQTTGR